MPPKEGALWKFFFKGPKQNASINEAYCLGCIRHHRCVEDPPNNTDLVLKDRLKWEEAAFTAAKRGHKDLGLKQPWIFVIPCCAHQYSHSTKGQLILSNYLAVNEEASVVAEQATDLIHWILSHDRVRKIFDDAQPKNNFVVLVYPLANITRWTTHYVAFHCLLNLKAPSGMQHTFARKR
ncbi:hypothetical protein C8J57DRAFT_1235922 [Mycena rebaudengoi]|nr:hypothetical protein C8J57DRAFT_1235922 [Mycena rebaudengoi]